MTSINVMIRSDTKSPLASFILLVPMPTTKIIFKTHPASATKKLAHILLRNYSFTRKSPCFWPYGQIHRATWYKDSRCNTRLRNRLVDPLGYLLSVAKKCKKNFFMNVKDILFRSLISNLIKRAFQFNIRLIFNFVYASAMKSYC